MRSSQTLAGVQSPIIPVVAEWLRQSPGTLSLGQGMVNYPPPPAALQALAGFGAEPADHLYGAALGHSRLLELIEQKLLAENGIAVTSGSKLMVTAGSNMAFLNAVLAITDPEDEVILPLPYYFNQEMALQMLGRRAVPVPTDADYQLDMTALQAAISAKTRAIVTISPNNPSGAVYPESTLREVNELCRARGLYHLSDEAYEYFTYDDARHFSPGSMPKAAAHTISLYSLSKAYGFASWRIGYMVFPEHLLPALLKIQDTNLICPPLITQYAAIGALETGSGYCRNRLPQLAAVRAQFLQHLRAIRDLGQISAGDGAFYFLLRLNTDRSDLALTKTLIDDFKVAAIPGSAFGINTGCALRLSYGMLTSAIANTALQRLVSGLKKELG